MNASSADVPPGVDEFELAWLRPRVDSSMFRGSPTHRLALECRYHITIALSGDDGSVNNVIIGRVIGIHNDDQFIRDGRMDTVAMGPITRLGHSKYSVVADAFRVRRPDDHRAPGDEPIEEK